MNKYNDYNCLVLFLCSALLVAGCTTQTERMHFVEKNLEEGRLVSEAAVNVPDVLNQYRHDYPAPTDREMAIYMDVDRHKVIASGDEIDVQVALVTRKLKPAPVNIHVLVYDESFSARDKDRYRDFLVDVISRLEKKTSLYMQGSQVTVDSALVFPGEASYKSIQAPHTSVWGLKPFLVPFAMTPMETNGHHFVLMVGDVSSISNAEQQDIIDIARIFTANGLKLSVLSYGEKPDFAFLTQLAEKGRGRMSVHNKDFNLDDWAQSEVELVHSYALGDVNLQLQAMNGVTIQKIISPANLYVSGNSVNMKLDNILTDQQYVMMLRVKVPAIDKEDERRILSLTGSYYNPVTDLFADLAMSKEIQYAFSKNDTRPDRRGRLVRSHMILDTTRTIIDVDRQVSNRRNFRAIATLTRQQRNLEKYLETTPDRELSRDLQVLRKYISMLSKFDGDWFKGVKIWKDLNWDRNRFNQQYD